MYQPKLSSDISASDTRRPTRNTSLLLTPEEERRVLDALTGPRGVAASRPAATEALLDWAYRAALDAHILRLVLDGELEVEVAHDGRLAFSLSRSSGCCQERAR
jgi:hypothetical protein